MNLLGASNLFMDVLNVYKKLKYIKDNRKMAGYEIKNIYNQETEYDELLGNLEILYSFPNTKDNRLKLQLFLMRYSKKIDNQYNKVRTQREDIAEVSVISPLKFGLKSSVEFQEDVGKKQSV